MNEEIIIWDNIVTLLPTTELSCGFDNNDISVIIIWITKTDSSLESFQIMDEDDEVFTLFYKFKMVWLNKSIKYRVKNWWLTTCRFSTDNSTIVSFNTLLFFVISNDICK